MRYKIHKEGYNILFFTTIFLLIVNYLTYLLYPGLENYRLFIAGLSGAFFLFVVAFFRIPTKGIFSKDDNEVLAPADGKIVAIEVVDETEYFKDKRIQVSIFMSPANVHVNRVPIPGRVEYTKYHPGNYLVAWHPKSSEKNERYTTVIKNEDGDLEVMVRQIAGKVARKISNYVDEGQTVMQGMEFGFIKFGSRVDIFLPLDAKINVDLKQKVKGGKTVLAELVESKDKPQLTFDSLINLIKPEAK